MKHYIKIAVFPLLIAILLTNTAPDNLMQYSVLEPITGTISPIKFESNTSTVDASTTDDSTTVKEDAEIQSSTVATKPDNTVIPDTTPKFPLLNPNSNWRSTLSVIDKPLPLVNSEERIYSPTHILLHFMSNANDTPTSPYLMNDIYSIFLRTELSAHYVIDRNGDIYLFTPENRVAYHAGPGDLSNYPDYQNRLNHHSIGIELLGIGTKSEMLTMISEDKYNMIPPSMYGFTDAQYTSLNMLLNDITSRHNSIQRNRTHILGHDEYNLKKADPGALFDWSRIGL